MIVALVVVATDTRVEDEAHKVCLDEYLNIARTPPHNADTRSREFVQSTLAHIACQHNIYSHIVERCGNVALAATSLWRRERFGGCNGFIFNGVDSVVVAMTKVVINPTISCRNSNLHNSQF